MTVVWNTPVTTPNIKIHFIILIFGNELHLILSVSTRSQYSIYKVTFTYHVFVVVREWLVRLRSMLTCKNFTKLSELLLSLGFKLMNARSEILILLHIVCSDFIHSSSVWLGCNLCDYELKLVSKEIFFKCIWVVYFFIFQIDIWDECNDLNFKVVCMDINKIISFLVLWFLWNI